jgi:hypothetical protein
MFGVLSVGDELVVLRVGFSCCFFWWRESLHVGRGWLGEKLGSGFELLV